jgi:hypothetical protein
LLNRRGGLSMENCGDAAAAGGLQGVFLVVEV